MHALSARPNNNTLDCPMLRISDDEKPLITPWAFFYFFLLHYYYINRIDKTTMAVTITFISTTPLVCYLRLNFSRCEERKFGLLHPFPVVASRANGDAADCIIMHFWKSLVAWRGFYREYTLLCSTKPCVHTNFMLCWVNAVYY